MNRISPDELFNASDEMDGHEATNKYMFIAKERNLRNFRVAVPERIMSVFGTERIVDSNLFGFMERNGPFLVVSNEILKSINAVYLRGIEKKENTVLLNGRKLPYGIGTLSRNRRFSDPLIICEGMADCEFIRTIYPDCIAMMGSTLSDYEYNIVKRLSGRILICTDNDAPGDSAWEKMKRKFKFDRVPVERIELPYGLKDAGDILELKFRRRTEDYRLCLELFESQIRIATSS